MLNQIELRGCAPTPLIHYLKALGILRLVAEQLDKNARGFWDGDAFVLETVKTKDELVRFFLDEYKPTPVVAPWNNSSGFYSKDKKARDYIEKLFHLSDPRFEEFYSVVKTARKIVGNRTEAPKDKEKLEMLRQARCLFSENALDWLDAAFVLGTEKPDYLPLLGSGGNDGNFSFTTNLFEKWLNVLPKNNSLRQQNLSRDQLYSSLFSGSVSLEKAVIGQFHPGGAGGANASQGVEGNFLVNPWDFIFIIEGSVMLASATVRQLAAGARSKASFPFTVRNSNVGYGTATENEKIRAEMWLPIWSRSTSYHEISQIFKEGRVQFSNRKQVRSGFDFARAVAELGVDRGIDAFERYAFIERNGQANLATPLGRFAVPKKESLFVSLINEEKFSKWLDTLRSSITDKTPPRFGRAHKRIETAIFNLCATGDKQYLLETLIALGAAENELANGVNHREKNKFLHPLSLNWSQEFRRKKEPDSHEFEIARALATIHGDNDKLGAVRSNLEPLDGKTKNWAQNSNSVVWTNASLDDNLSAVLQRRSIEARQGAASHPLVAGSQFAALRSIAAFLKDETDDKLIEDYLFGLVLIDWKQRDVNKEPQSQGEVDVPADLPRAYALLKLLFLPNGRFRRAAQSEPKIIKHEPAIVPLLRANRVREALELAARRLKSSGLTPLADNFYFDGQNGARLAAALLIPIYDQAVFALADSVLRKPKTENI